jgi:hypothetical protein
MVVILCCIWFLSSNAAQADEQCDLIKLLSYKINNFVIPLKYFEEREVQSIMADYSTFVQLWEIFLESEMANYLTKRQIKLPVSFLEKVRNHYKDFYHLLITNELDMIDLKSIKVICHVGIGEISVSCLLINKISSCKVIGIDMLPQAIESTRQFLSSRSDSYENHFELHCCDGNEFDYHLSDLVIISVSVTNKHEVLNQIKLRKKFLRKASE